MTNHNEELEKFIEQRRTTRIQEAALTQQIKKIRTQLSEAKKKNLPNSFQLKWQKALRREKEERIARKRIRLLLYKALKLLKYKNKEIAQICRISPNRMQEFKKNLERSEQAYGKWFKNL